MNNSEDESLETDMLPTKFQECHPISNVDDIETVISDPPSWIQRIEPLQMRYGTVIKNEKEDCHRGFHHFPLRNRYDSRFVPKTLICHDYKGGYLEDRFLHSPNENILGKGYTFYNWSQIDIFVYFSHYLITVPPLSWINAAHKNGVKILGTFITEFDDGKKVCEKIFKEKNVMEKFVENLTLITKTFNLDGWLLNIENKIEDTAVLGNLKNFVRLLTKSIHRLSSENVVIWYDSVTETGELSWQNELNSLNQYFFNVCDGIFLNYVWTEKSLIKSVEIARHRHLDVYVGIDVFGRNTFGGGMFDCYKAAELIRKYNCSMAIFAPGWTLEILDDDKYFFQEFLNRDSTFWSSLWSYLYTHPICDYFETWFYIGLDKKHYNLFSQQRQLSHFLQTPHTGTIPKYSSIEPLKDACNCLQTAVLFNKNSCILTSKHLPKPVIHQLFWCDLKIKYASVVIYYVTKNLEDSPNSNLTITLTVSRDNGTVRLVKLLQKAQDITLNTSSILEVNPCEDVQLITGLKSEYNLTDRFDLKLSVYWFAIEPGRIMEIGGTVVNGHSIFLCAFGIR